MLMLTIGNKQFTTIKVIIVLLFYFSKMTITIDFKLEEPLFFKHKNNYW